MKRFLSCTCLLALVAGVTTSGVMAQSRTSSSKKRQPAFSKQKAPAQNAPAINMKPAADAPMAFTPMNDGLPDAGMWKGDPIFVDVNNDTKVDLAAIRRLGDGPRVWINNSKGWIESSNGLNPAKRSCGGGLDFADFNSDGHIDMAVADHCQGVYVYLGDGKGNWQEVTTELNPIREADPADPKDMAAVGAEDISIADLTGDGKLDLLVGSSDEGGVHIYAGDGTGRNWKHVSSGLPMTGWANRVVAKDVNKDGLVDVVASYDRGPRVWINNGKQFWVATSDGLPKPMIGGLYHGLAVEDMNKDGRQDIIVANWVDGPEVYFQKANGKWEKANDVFPHLMGGAIGLAVGDINLDSHMDIVITGRLESDPGYVRGVFPLLGNSKGSWTYAANCGLPSTGLGTMMGVAIGDINNDGMPDVAASGGLKVESAVGRTEPIIPTHMMVWINNINKSAKLNMSSNSSGVATGR